MRTSPALAHGTGFTIGVDSGNDDMRLQRRRFLVGGLGGLASVAGFGRASAALTLEANELAFYHIHTAEKLSVAYRDNGKLVPDALAAINHLLRDFRTGQAHEIDVELLDTLSLLHEAADRRGHFEIISGYRSPRTNAALREVTSGVAENSLHIKGRAIDVRSTGITTAQLRAAALELARGGVGYYPESNFVHVDTGAFRAW
jgi:uncharacterized protein YcbK (DUF882 family)